VTQLRNQDPMSPMDGSQFAAQLAQFSTVEQLIEIRDQMESQAMDSARNALTTQTLLGTSLIGREVLLLGATVSVDGETDPRIAIELNGPAEKVTIEIIGDDDEVIATQEFSDMSAGRAVLKLDDLGLDEGHYAYRVTA